MGADVNERLLLDGFSAALADLVNADGVFIVAIRKSGKHIASAALNEKKDLLRLIGAVEAAKLELVKTLNINTVVEDESKEREDSQGQ